MAKFSNLNPLDRVRNANSIKAEKRKPGRPKVKTEETKIINIAVPISILEKMNVAKSCYGNNLTQYINKLIEKDITSNYDTYKNIYNSLNDLK